jgi:hypothetical protein
MKVFRTEQSHVTPSSPLHFHLFTSHKTLLLAGFALPLRAFPLSSTTTTTTTTTTTIPAATAATTTTMPPRSARIGARVLRLTYWTADTEGCGQIKAWLEENLGDEQLKFLGSFINKCTQEMQKLKSATTKWSSVEDKERVLAMREVLRAFPLDVRAYIGLLDASKRRDFTAGGRYKTGFIAKPENGG